MNRDNNSALMKAYGWLEGGIVRGDANRVARGIRELATLGAPDHIMDRIQDSLEIDDDLVTVGAFGNDLEEAMSELTAWIDKKESASEGLPPEAGPYLDLEELLSNIKGKLKHVSDGDVESIDAAIAIAEHVGSLGLVPDGLSNQLLGELLKLNEPTLGSGAFHGAIAKIHETIKRIEDWAQDALDNGEVMTAGPHVESVTRGKTAAEKSASLSEAKPMHPVVPRDVVGAAHKGPYGKLIASLAEHMGTDLTSTVESWSQNLPPDLHEDLMSLQAEEGDFNQLIDDAIKNISRNARFDMVGYLEDMVMMDSAGDVPDRD